MTRIKCLFLFLVVLISSPATFSQETEGQLKPNSLHTGYYLNSFSDISIKDLQVALSIGTSELSKHAGVKATTTVYKNLDEMRTDFYQGKINFVVATPLVFVTEFDQDQLAGAIRPVIEGESADKLLVVTHKESNLNHFSQLKNKKISLLVNDPVSLLYCDVLALENVGSKSTAFFSKIDYMNKSNRLIYSLFFKRTDAILVYMPAYKLAIELNPQIGETTQIISVLSGMHRAMSFFHKRVEPEFREFIIAQGLKMHDSIRGQQLLTLFQADKKVRSSLADLKPTQKLLERYRQLISQTQN